jgi:hypothetical protein
VKIGTHETHPAADLFPLVEGAEFDALVADVKQRGLRNPVVLFNGRLLDGRNRLRACLAADVEPRFVHFSGSDADAWGEVWSQNSERRHLAAPWKAAIRLRFDNEIRDLRERVAENANAARSAALAGKSNNPSGKARSKTLTPASASRSKPGPGVTRKALAKAAGVGVQKALRRRQLLPWIDGTGPVWRSRFATAQAQGRRDVVPVGAHGLHPVALARHRTLVSGAVPDALQRHA